MSETVRELQLELMGCVGCDPGPLDGLLGPRTSLASVAAWRSGALSPGHPLFGSIRAEVAGGMRPHSLIRKDAGKYLADMASPRGYGRWTDGGSWALQHIRRFDLPLVGLTMLNVEAAPAFILALGEIETTTKYVPGIHSSYCIRRMCRDPGSPWSTHATAHAIDFDLDLDGRWERRENLERPELVKALDIMRSWGIVLGVDWKGTAEDDMHAQACLVG